MPNACFNTLISNRRKIYFSSIFLSIEYKNLFWYLIKSKVESQCCNVSGLAAAANVSQLQLEVVPAAVGHVNLIQTQTHQSGSTAGHGEHQLAIYHLEKT